MSRNLFILNLIIAVLIPCDLFSQGKSAFSGDPVKYREELTAFMGPNLNDVQKKDLNAFLAGWDSTAFSKDDMIRIIDLSSQFSGRLMRPVPHFNDFLKTLNDFTESKHDPEILKTWLIGLSEISFNPRFSNENIDRYFKNTSLMIKDNILSETGTIRWKVKNNNLRFLHDTAFYVAVTDATLTCYSQQDSSEIYNVSGFYFPDILQFHGTRGTVTWEKAGYAREDVFAELDNYTINTTKNNFSADSVRLTHKTYFKEPVYGKLSDQTISYTDKTRINFPRFETYTSQFKLENIYEGVNYEGGLLFEGANVKGTGTSFVPAKITLARNDTLYLKITAREFTFSKNGLNSGETSMSLYLDKDSIFHSDLSFSYNAPTRQVNLFSSNNPVSKSPYFDSFHNLDMYFEYLSWDMDESRIALTRPRGAALGQAQFESVSFFDANYFMRLMGIDEYHPLVRLKRFAEWYYSTTFPVEEFARWLGKPVDVVTGLCIDMATRGFVFYNRSLNEVTLKKKVDDYLTAFAKKKDYDVLSIMSETKAPVDNALLDIRDYRLTVNGVTGVYLSDSQRVAIYPYNRQLVIGKNRSLEFDGVVAAGLFTFFGHNFSFSYDTFKISMGEIDSIRIAVETSEKDAYGNPLIKDIDNMIQLATAELFIDDPNNKSGLRSLKEYPVVNATNFSYIFFDKLPGLEGIYKQKDFYFKVDTFTYNNIDHYKPEDMNLAGEFHGGNILEPIRHYLIIEENNSLGFNMSIPEEGIEVYGNKGRFYDNIRMSNKGLVGSGILKRLTSTTKSDDFKFFPDSMLTQATSFNIEKDSSGLFPELNSQDVSIKWLTQKDEWLAVNAEGKYFNMYANGTVLDGNINLAPSFMKGSGIINMTDSRITSDQFNFAANSIRADTAVYNLKSPSTSGYAFLAENVNTDINFDLKTTRFHLNTGSSVVKFPEVQYICTMTDFVYNMETRVLNMEQKGKSDIPLLTPDKLIRLDFSNLDKPTFFATNNLRDTIAFSSWKGSYHVDEEYIEAENINYIHVADALIQPDSGKIIITRRAKIKQLQNAIIAVNNRHILHSANIDIESTKRYAGSAVYDYIDEDKAIQQISLPEVTVDTLTTTARGYIPASQKFMLSPAFSYSGDVTLSARNDLLFFTGGAGIAHNCPSITSYSVKFKSFINPGNVIIPVSEKPRDLNDNLVFSGSFINIDSIHIYPAFLSAQKSWTDVNLVNANGFLYFEKSKGRYLITSLEKIADQSLHGDMIAFDKNYCVLSGEGKLNFGAKFDLVKMAGAGKVIHSLDSGDVNIQAILGFDFYFSEEALTMMSDEIRMMPSLKPVNLNSDLNNKGMKDLMGVEAASQIKDEMNLFGTSRSLPKEYSYKLLLNDVNLYWNESSSSFRSNGNIGIGFIGQQPVNVYVDGYIELQRRRTGDVFDIYLKADESTWYYFSYIRGSMMAQAGNNNFNTLIANIKIKERRHPDSSVRVPYTYMIAVEDRLGRFLQRMTGSEPIENADPLDGLIK